MVSCGPKVPSPSGEVPYPSPLAMDGRCLGGGGDGAPWRPHAWGEQGGPQWPPSVEEKGSYGASITESRGRPWLPPEEEKVATWGPSRESWPAEREGRVRSWEPPQNGPGSPPVGGWLRVPLSPPRDDSWEPPAKRVRSPPMGEWRRVPLSPPRGGAWTRPDTQEQTSGLSSHNTHREPRSKRSRWDSCEKVGSPWVPQSRWDGPTTQSMGSSLESPVPAKTWESCRDPETLQPASGRATEERDPQEPGVSSSSSRGNPMWQTRLGNPVDGSYSVKAGGSKASWSERRFQSFQSQVDNREWDNRGPKGQQDEGWARDEGLKEPLISKQDRARPVGFPRESIPRRGQGAFSGSKGDPERYKGPGTQAVTHRTWLPRAEVVEYWTRCHQFMGKKVRYKFLSVCPRPSILDCSADAPVMNPDLKQLIGTHINAHFTNVHVSSQTQWDILNMLGPAMALYDMAEVAIERQEKVDPLAVRPLARCLLSFMGSANQRLTQQRCSEVFQAIDPRLVSLVPKMSKPNSGGWLFAEDKVDVLKGVIRSLETLPEDPSERNSGNRRQAGRRTLMASHRETASLFQDGAALLPEPNSGKKAQLQDEASLELWHRRFGHANSNTILRLKTDKHVTGINVDTGEGNNTAECITCLTEWVRKPRCPCPLVTVRSTTVLMDLVHCELYGPFDVPSLTLHRYVLIFVEDFSRFCVTYLLKETNETHECFEKYLALLRMREKSLKSKPKAFQLNSAADAVSSQTLDFLEAQGIAHKRDVESIPRKCRTAENEMKSLLEMTRCMLADAMLPEHFWGYAILAATYLQNRLPFKRNKRTSFQDWYGTLPNVKHLRVFGSLFHNRQEPTDDVQYVFIGYISCKAGYQFMNLETGVTLKRHTQAFDEGKGVKKRGKFLEAIERHGCDIETLTDIIVSMTPQPERYTTKASGETREETSRSADGNGDEED